MLHPKTIHYPSGYPMARSPPLFICSSPGPDPYRSHDNVYEELEHRRDIDSERIHRSDDEFAEDELSLPGERSFQKSSPDTTTVATIYQERSNSSNGAGSSSTDAPDPYLERNRTERNSLLSSSSSGNDNLSTSNRPIRNSNSSSDCGGNGSGSSVVGGSGGGLGLSLFRCRSSNNNKNNRNKPTAQSADELNSSLEPNNSDIPPIIYDHRSLLSLPPSYSSAVNNNNFVNNNLDGANSNDTNHVNNNHNDNNSNNVTRSNYYGPIDDEVERRNQINSQISQHPVATIYRDRSGIGGRLHHHHHHPPLTNRLRTNPRSLDRRRILGTQPALSFDPNYHEAMLYDTCMQHGYNPDRQPIYPYILPEFTTFRLQQNGQANPPHAVYSRDSNFGSDSGYSHNTQNSSRSGPWSRRQKEQNPPNSSNSMGRGTSPNLNSS